MSTKQWNNMLQLTVTATFKSQM